MVATRHLRLLSLAFSLSAFCLSPLACGGDEFVGSSTFGTAGTAGAAGAAGVSAGGSSGLDASTDSGPEAGKKDGGGGSGGEDCAAKDLQSDADNCGTCHHSCLGGACDKGVCQPVVLFQNSSHPEAGAIGTLGRLRLIPGATSLLVWLDNGDLGAPGATGMVWSMLADGTSLKQVVPGGMTEPRYLAVGGAKVYWTGSEGAVYANNVTGGAPVLLASGQPGESLRGIAISGNELWYAEGPAIKHLNVLTPANVSMILTTAGPSDLAISDGALYFVDSANGGIGRIDNGAATLLAHGQNSPRGLYAEPGSDGRLFWLDGAGAVWTVGKSGAGLPEQLTTPADPADANPQDLTGDDEYVYWTSWGSCVNSAGCTNANGTTDPLRGRVQRVRKDGTGLRVLFDGFSLPTGIAVDDEAVYWTTWWFTVLQKLAK